MEEQVNRKFSGFFFCFVLTLKDQKNKDLELGSYNKMFHRKNSKETQYNKANYLDTMNNYAVLKAGTYWWVSGKPVCVCLGESPCFLCFVPC